MKTTTKKRFSVKWRILIPIVCLNAVIMGLLGFFAIQQSSAVTRELAAEIAEQVDGLSAAAEVDRVNTEEAISTALQTALAYTNQMAFEAGSADMFRSVYDPDGHECDIYGYAREQAEAAAEEAVQTAREAARAAEDAETAAGTAQESADEARAYAQVLLAHTKSGTVHTLAGLDGRSGVLTAMFRATGGYAEGNTFKVDGTVYTAKMPDGEGLSDGAFASGSVVGVIIDTENKTVNFKGGGGVKLPALSNPAAAAQIFSGYEAIDGAGQAMTGTAGSSITKAATAARIEKGYQALTKAGVMLTGTMEPYYRQLHTYKATSTKNNSSTSLKATGSTIDLAVAYCTQANSSGELFGGFAVFMNNALLFDEFGNYVSSNASISGTTIEVVLNYRDITQNNDNDPLNLNILIFSH